MHRGTHVTFATYNVHRCVGRDGRRRPERVAEVVRALDADVVGLQEVESRFGADADAHQLDYLATRTGMQAVAGPTVLRPDSEYGNAVLTRLPVLAVRRLDLSVDGCEPRGAVDVDIDAGAGPLRVISIHLGLRYMERREQIRRLLAALEHPARSQIVLLGDINEWIPRSRGIRRLQKRLGRARALRTFPAGCPLLALDRIWVHPRPTLERMERCATRLARIASDHLPVHACVRVGTHSP